LEDLLDVLDRCDADLRFVISPDGPYIGRIGTDPAAMMEGNRMIHDLCRRAPGRLFGSCLVNPNFPDESLRVMKTCFEEWGFVMLGEMFQYIYGFKMQDPGAEKVVRLAAKYQVPVQVHIATYWQKDAGSSGDGMNHMADLLVIAERAPEAKYILAHAIGCGPAPDYIPWADMFFDVIKGVFPKHPDNFWWEIRDFQALALPRTLREVPVTRLLSGTDWTTRVGPPFQSYGTMFGVKEADNPFPPRVESFVGFLRKAGATESDIARVGYENARELFKLPS
jgi:predicted TIM-barrel fold metal-dependent hydrolase